MFGKMADKIVEHMVGNMLGKDAQTIASMSCRMEK